jgi:hypothetical protein
MTITSTPRLGLPQADSDTDLWPARGGWNDILLDIDTLTAIDIQVANLAARPAAGVRGRYCWVEDTDTLYRDDGVAWFHVFTQTTRLNDLGEPDGDVDMGGFKLTDLANGAAAQDAATKGQLDGHANAAAAHGATGAVVGTTNVQTLTNKTLTAPIIDGFVPGTYADYVPTISGVGATVNVARFTRLGAKRISGYVLFTLTAAPTGFVTCTLPVAARAALVRLAIGPATIKASGIVSDSVAVIDGDATIVYIAKGDDFMKNGQGWVSGNAVGLSFDYEAA